MTDITREDHLRIQAIQIAMQVAAEPSMTASQQVKSVDQVLSDAEKIFAFLTSKSR